MENQNFFKTLMDSSFNSFITRKVSRVLYAVLSWLFIALGFLFELGAVGALFSGGSTLTGYAVLAVFAIPVLTFVLVIVLRLAFESGIALVLIAENTTPKK